MSRTIRVASVQMFTEPAPTRQRLERAETLVAQAARSGAQLVVLPEVFSTGYEYSDQNYERAERLDGQTVSWMKSAAAQHGVHVAGSLLLLDEEDIYNALLLAAPDGRTWRYNKNYPYMWERAYFRQGHDITVADTELGKLGLMICMDQGRAELWARYAGKVDAMVICSCPPAMHETTLAFPGGQRVKSCELGPAMQSIAQSGGETFGAYLRRQAAWLGVPVVNSTGTGTFSSRLPMPHLSLAIYSAMRPDLWRYLSQADRVRLEAGYFNETYVADAAGRVLAQVPPETEGYALAQITLADALPQPRGQQPRFGLPDVAYHLVDFANIALTPLYRRNVRRFYGPRMAPPGRQTRLWMGVIVFASVLGYWLGKAAGRRR